MNVLIVYSSELVIEQNKKQAQNPEMGFCAIVMNKGTNVTVYNDDINSRFLCNS